MASDTRQKFFRVAVVGPWAQITLRSQADERTEREWSSGGDSEQLVGTDAATSLLVSSSSDGDMLLQVGCRNHVYE